MGRRQRHLLFAAALALVVAAVALPGALGSTAANDGGTFRIVLPPGAGLDHIDPALSYTPAGWALLDTVCARLMTYPDKPPPAGFRLQPEVAAAPPAVSRDLKTYTFRLRGGFRFADGTPVRADAFARAINRTLDPAMKSWSAVHLRDIVGARDVIDGKRKTAVGVVASGNTLVVRLTRAAPDFPALTTLPFFCAVPPGLPADPEGVRRLPGAGPYYVEQYRPGERLLILRNRFYGGTRPHHVDGFDVDLRTITSPSDMVQRVDRGEADWGLATAPIFLDPTLGLVPKYGINRSGSRFFLKPGLTLRMLAFNSARPLFRNNPALRKAVNFALDREALQNASGGSLTGVLTDQYLPPSVSGFRDADVYPLTRANLQRARELAAGNLRGGKAVLYTNNSPPPMAVGQLVGKQLAEIGLDVEVKGVPYHTGTAAYFSKLTGRDEPWDIAVVLWTPSIPDPYAYINMLLDGQHLGGTNVGGFASSAYDRQMRDVARILQSSERLRAYGSLDARLARDAAPLAALSVLNEPTFVSDRVGCIVMRPMLDLTAVCLK